eukprot:scaffold24778_cov67-Cyclotella_meneghiniana.AAC.10
MKTESGIDDNARGEDGEATINWNIDGRRGGNRKRRDKQCDMSLESWMFSVTNSDEGDDVGVILEDSLGICIPKMEQFSDECLTVRAQMFASGGISRLVRRHLELD